MKKDKEMRTFTSKELKHRIQVRHPVSKSWFTFLEVGAVSGTWGKAGMIDAVAVCLSAPRDFAVHGFEVKVTRADWLTELNNPRKNAYAIPEMDYWWVVAPTSEIVKPDELPSKWGLYTCSGRGLRVTKRAKRIGKAGEPFSRSFIVSLLWKLTKWSNPSEKQLDAAYQRGREDGRVEGEKWANSDRKWQIEELQNKRAALKRFEEKAGYPIDEYNAGRLGKLAIALVDLRLKRSLEHSLESSIRFASELESAMREAHAELVGKSAEKEEEDGS